MLFSETCRVLADGLAPTEKAMSISYEYLNKTKNIGYEYQSTMNILTKPTSETYSREVYK